MSTILIAGGTGLIGTALGKFLTGKGYVITILTRHPRPAANGINYAVWNTEKQTIDADAIQKADYIINLAGAGVADKRWTKKRKQEIIDSRVKSGKLLVKALTDIPNNVKAVINVSGIGWYGDDKNKKDIIPFKETDPADEGFLGTTCVQWEESIQPVANLRRRLVKYRLGIVLSKEGGALKEFIRPVRFGIAAILGSGKQIISWIHIEDLCRLFLHAIENEKIQGIYNAVAPQPVSNKQFTLTLAEQMKGKFYISIPVPSFVLKIILGEMSVEILKSTTVSGKKISTTGFQFLYPSIEAALHDLTKKQ